MPEPMIKKGSSRKGARRRHSIEAIRPCDEPELQRRPAAEEVVKLIPTTNRSAKEISRIDTPVFTERAPLTRHAANNELNWGQKSTKREHRWVWIFSFIAIALLFGAIASVNYISKLNDTSSDNPIGQFIVVPDELESRSPLFSFEKNPYQVRLECIKVFRQFTAALKESEIHHLIRQQADTEALLAQHWQPWPSPPLLDDPDQLTSDFDETNGRGFLWLQGKNQDGTSFLAFFVATENSFLLDWEATMELGEARLTSLVRNPTSHPVALRVILSPSDYYLPTLPESEYESYQITCLQDDTTCWGYAKRGSPEQQSINELLQKDAVFLEAKKEMRFAVRLKKADVAFAKNHFLITEMLHKDWVMP